MPGTLTVRITESGAALRDARYRYIWSAWLDGRLLGKGYAFKPDIAEAKALDLVSPDEVEHIQIDYRPADRVLSVR